MASEIRDLQIAPPMAIVEAWIGGVMHGEHPGGPSARERALHLMKAYPVPADMDDPTFVTPDGPDRSMVWHRAREISNPRAMHDLQVYLHERGLCLPPDVMFAWARTSEKAQWAREIRDAVNDVIAAHIEESETLTELWEWVSEEVLRRTEVVVEARDA